MTGLEYEHQVAKYLSHHGYTGVQVTKGSGDFGVDVIAHKNGLKYAVQCKYYTGPVSLSAVQEAVAGKAMYNCDAAMVVTNSTFTKPAQELAKKNNVVLMSNVAPGSASSGCGCSSKGILLILVAYFLMCVAVIVLSINNVLKDPTWNSVWVSIRNVVEITVPIWIYFIVKKIIKYFKSDHPKRIYFVFASKKPDSFQQTVEHHKRLGVSEITGLPNQFEIKGESFDLDKIEDVERMPLNFSSFHINGTKYYFNNYFRLCAKLYKAEGYVDLSKALTRKAAELETHSLHGKFMRGKAKTFIRAPRECNVDFSSIIVNSDDSSENTDSTTDSSEYPEGFQKYLNRRPGAPVPDQNAELTHLNRDAVIETLKQIKSEEPDIYDVLYDAIMLGINNKMLSPSTIQRYLKVGYVKATRIIDVLNMLGFVSPVLQKYGMNNVIVTEREVIDIIAEVEMAE